MPFMFHESCYAMTIKIQISDLRLLYIFDGIEQSGMYLLNVLPSSISLRSTPFQEC